MNVRDLPGRPDIVLSRARIAVQVDGCFWHGCPDHAIAPKSNADWWRSKLEATRQRDERNDRVLTAEGWFVMRVWEHEDPSDAADRIETEWRARTGRTSQHEGRSSQRSSRGQA